MERFKKCSIKLDKDKVNRLVKFKYGTIENYLKKEGITRMRFWQILNQPHLSKDVECLQNLASKLDVNIQEILK